MHRNIISVTVPTPYNSSIVSEVWSLSLVSFDDSSLRTACVGCSLGKKVHYIESFLVISK